jgi:hypothetical protein
VVVSCWRGGFNVPGLRPKVLRGFKVSAFAVELRLDKQDLRLGRKSLRLEIGWYRVNADGKAKG